MENTIKMTKFSSTELPYSVSIVNSYMTYLSGGCAVHTMGESGVGL